VKPVIRGTSPWYVVRGTWYVVRSESVPGSWFEVRGRSGCGRRFDVEGGPSPKECFPPGDLSFFGAWASLQTFFGAAASPAKAWRQRRYRATPTCQRSHSAPWVLFQLATPSIWLARTTYHVPRRTASRRRASCG